MSSPPNDPAPATVRVNLIDFDDIDSLKLSSRIMCTVQRCPRVLTIPPPVIHKNHIDEIALDSLHLSVLGLWLLLSGLGVDYLERPA